MKEFSFDLSAFDVDDFVSQIICINADLYGQLQVAELVDLRFQKDKKFSVSVTKLQNFSNKVRLNKIYIIFTSWHWTKRY